VKSLAQVDNKSIFTETALPANLLRNIIVCRLQRLEEEVISKRVKLIILDSVASLVRKEFDSRVSRNLNERTALLSKEAAILK